MREVKCYEETHKEASHDLAEKQSKRTILMKRGRERGGERENHPNTMIKGAT